MKIAKVLGTDDLFKYIKKYNLELDENYNKILGIYGKKAWGKFITPENKHLCADDAIDLLSKMLIYDHADRITPKDAMEHAYFLPLKKKNWKNNLS